MNQPLRIKQVKLVQPVTTSTLTRVIRAMKWIVLSIVMIYVVSVGNEYYKLRVYIQQTHGMKEYQERREMYFKSPSLNPFKLVVYF